MLALADCCLALIVYVNLILSMFMMRKIQLSVILAMLHALHVLRLSILHLVYHAILQKIIATTFSLTTLVHALINIILQLQGLLQYALLANIHVRHA